MEYSLIEHVDLTPEKVYEYSQIMAAGNEVINKYCRVFGKKKNRRSMLLNKLFHKTPRYRLHHNDIDMTKEEWEKILALKQIEEKVLAGFSNLAGQMISEYSKKKRFKQSTMDLDDLKSVAVNGLYAAIWGYRKTNVKFITYATNVINKTIRREILKCGRGCGVKDWNADMLMAAYYQALMLYPELPFELVLGKVRIRKDPKSKSKAKSAYRTPTEREIEAIREIFRPKMYSGDIAAEDENSSKFDFQDHLGEEWIDEIEVKDIIRRANLTEQEEELLRMEMEQGWGSHVEWANKNGFSKNWATKVFQKITEKLEPHLKKALSPD